MKLQMKKRVKTGIVSICSIFLLLSAGTTTAAQKDIEVLPANSESSVDLQININKTKFYINGRAEFSFRASQTGYVSLWDIGTSGKVSRIFPNSYSGDGQVQGNVSYGAGGAQSNYAFTIKGPTGMEDVYMLWTATRDGQPTKQQYKNAGVLSKDLAVVERIPRSQWATTKVTFEITEPNMPAAPRIAPPSTTVNTSGNVYILAMGANVSPLQKTNADAENFTNAMQQLFRVPGSNIRMISNARVSQFRESMSWLRQVVRPNDLVLIFFSGHGSTIADDDGDENGGQDEIFIMYDH